MEKRIVKSFHEEPTIRVSLADGKSSWDFSLSEPFSLFEDSGRPILQNHSSRLRWRIKLESYEPAQYAYSLMLGDALDPRDAEGLARRIVCHAFDPVVRPVGGAIILDGAEISRNDHYRILLGEFNSREDAVAYGWKYLEMFDGEVVREKIRESRGTMEIFDAEYGFSARVDRSLTVVSHGKKSCMTLYDVPLHDSEGNGRSGKQRCSLPLSFHIGDGGDILAVSETPFESYLTGVLHTAMHPESPMDALKSQAVASRGWILSHLGILHAEEPYDVCSHPHCQPYRQMIGTEAKPAEAIDATRGEALFYGERLCKTPFTRQCGGYTDDRNGFSEPYIRVVFDGPTVPKRARGLHREERLARWMAASPDVYCKPNGDAEAVFHPAGHAFRWEVSHARRELEAILKKKTGEDIGFLVDVVPLKRSVSGRIQDIEILGSRRNLRLRRDFAIRHAFSEPGLRSTCFLVSKEMGGDGLPSSLTFIGAGDGHGVGLCQMGAMRLASQGRRYDEILKHYFKDVELRKLYR